MAGEAPPVAPRQPFSIGLHRLGGRAARVAVAGELDLCTAPELAPAVNTALSDAEEVVLDLARVDFIDSTGLRAVLRVLQTPAAAGKRVTLSPVLMPQARRLMGLVGLLELLPWAPE